MFIEERNGNFNIVHKFNAKELDSETNLTYHGARYLDMKTSLWLNVDPLSGYNPILESEHYIDGEYNGGVLIP